MEKLLYLAYRANDESSRPPAAGFRESLAAELLDSVESRALRISVADEDVEPARHLRMQSGPRLPDALLSVWLDSCLDRAPLETVLAGHFPVYHGFLVTESEPLVNREHPAAPGARVFGMSQVALLQKPDRLSYAQWLAIWQGSHTRIAIDTQSTFGYRQNVIVRPLTGAAPSIHAIVEENFPPEAMTSSHLFYAAEGDDALLQQRIEAMMASCARFIDFDRIDVVPMSEYVIRDMSAGW